MAHDKIDPISILLRFLFTIPSIKKYLQKRGMTEEIFNKRIEDVIKNPYAGFNIAFATKLILAIPFFFLMGLHNLYFIVLSSKEVPYICPLIIYCIISFAISHILLFQKDKYIKYFKMFNKKPNQWKVKWAWISFGVMLFPFVFFLVTMLIL